MTAPTPATMPTHPADGVLWTPPGTPPGDRPSRRRARLRDDLTHHTEQLEKALAGLRGHPADEDLALEKYFRTVARFQRALEAFNAALADVDIPLPHVADRAT